MLVHSVPVACAGGVAQALDFRFDSHSIDGFSRKCTADPESQTCFPWQGPGTSRSSKRGGLDARSLCLTRAAPHLSMPLLKYQKPQKPEAPDRPSGDEGHDKLPRVSQGLLQRLRFTPDPATNVLVSRINYISTTTTSAKPHLYGLIRTRA